VKREMRGNTEGVLLRIVRVAAGLTQEQVAQKKHMDRATLSRIESGSFIPPMPLYELLVEECGGVRRIDWLIEQLKRLRQQMLMPSGQLLHA
jgi:transcriptional regulator with XRE-family HTH domain